LKKKIFSGHFWPFLGLFGYFFAKQLFSSFLVKRTIIWVRFSKIFKASPHYRGKKLVEFDLDLLEITHIDRNDVISRVLSFFLS